MHATPVSTHALVHIALHLYPAFQARNCHSGKESTRPMCGTALASHSGRTGGPSARAEGLHFAVTNLTSDQMVQSHNHVCATEFFNLSMTLLNASGPIMEPN